MYINGVYRRSHGPVAVAAVAARQLLMLRLMHFCRSCTHIHKHTDTHSPHNTKAGRAFRKLVFMGCFMHSFRRIDDGPYAALGCVMNGLQNGSVGIVCCDRVHGWSCSCDVNNSRATNIRDVQARSGPSAVPLRAHFRGITFAAAVVDVVVVRVVHLFPSAKNMPLAGTHAMCQNAYTRQDKNAYT